MEKKKVVLVTGCAGFIGSHLVSKLLKQGFQVMGLDNFDDFYPRNIKEKNLAEFIDHQNFTFREFDICRDDFEILEEPVDIVVHLAAKAGVLPSVNNPVDFLEVNVMGTQRVLEFMRNKGIRKLVFASSSSIYGNSKEIPFQEDADVSEPISPYASTKKSCELLIHTYHHLFDFDVINLRFFTVYGPKQRPDLAIHKFVHKIINQQVIQVYGDGSTSRDYTFIDDIVSGIEASIDLVGKSKGLYEIMNLGNGNPITLKSMIDVLFEVFGPTELEYVAKQPGDVDITYADISKAQKLLNYSPQTSFFEGILKFKEWYALEGALKV
ncbi:MAG: GDP-mannose 4,6-dehydratase [Flavobacteriales bacterium]|nr:GDP-mannose 4,6-dehydratase [Flavobacteriales bacterium]